MSKKSTKSTKSVQSTTPSKEQAMQVNTNIFINQLVKALITAGYVDDVINAPKLSPRDYMWFVDDKADAKLILTAVNKAYCATVGAGLREADGTTTIFDDSTAGTMGESTSELEDRQMSPEKPMTYEEARNAAAIAYQVAVSMSRHPGNEWMTGFTTSSTYKDAAGEWQVERIKQTPLLNFDQWLVRSMAETPSDSTWFASLVRTRQLGLSVPTITLSTEHDGEAAEWDADGSPVSFDAEAEYHTEIHEAQQRFISWIEDTPWTREGLDITRQEQIVTRSADKKWAEFCTALRAKNVKTIEKVLKDWTIMVHSPKMHQDIESIKASATYQLHIMEQDMEKQETQLMKLEFLEEHAAMRAQMAARQVQIDERMAHFAAPATARADTMVLKTEAAESMAQSQSHAPAVHDGKGAASTARTFGIR